MTDSHSGAVQLVGGVIQVGATPPGSPGSFNISLTETLAGYGNSPKTTTLSITEAAVGSMSGSVTTYTTDQAINMTALAGTDWVVYGYHINAASIERKATGGSLFSTLTGGVGTYNNTSAPSFSLSWTDGTPDATISAERYAVYNNNGLGQGFSFTAPASTATRTLTVYAAVSNGSTGMKLTATLSDGSAGPYVDTSVVGGGANVLAKYVIVYNAATSGQTVTVAIVNNTSAAQSVNIYGATLS